MQEKSLSLASLTPHLPEPQVYPYVVSKAFVSQVEQNKLWAFSSLIFSLVSHIRQATLPHNFSEFKADIEHELQAFQSAALRASYPLEQVQLAYFMLAALLDTVIESKGWSKTPEWSNYTFVSSLAFEDNEQEQRGLALLAKLRETPSTYLDLIELLYFCFSLGLEPKDSHLSTDPHILDKLVDDLYRIIRQQRGAHPSLFVIETAEGQPEKIAKPMIIYGKAILLTGLSVIGLTYVGALLYLHYTLQPISHLMQQALNYAS